MFIFVISQKQKIRITKDYTKPCIRSDCPDQTILHVGTNENEELIGKSITNLVATDKWKIVTGLVATDLESC